MEAKNQRNVAYHDRKMTKPLSSDADADAIFQLICGAKNFKYLIQAIEMGIFDELEGRIDATPVDSLANKFGYQSGPLEKFLNVMCALGLLGKTVSPKGKVSYLNKPGASKYLTRCKKPTMLGVAMMENTMLLPMVDMVPLALKSGSSGVNVMMPKKGVNMENMPKMPPGMKPDMMPNMPPPNMPMMPPNMPPSNTPMMPPNMTPSNMPPMPPNMTPSNMPAMPQNRTPSNMPAMPPNMKGPNMPGSPPPHMAAMKSEMQMKFFMCMDAMMMPAAPAICKAFDLRSHSKVVDLGGGTGSLAMELSKTYPTLDIKVLDLPDVVQMAKKMSHNIPDNVTFYPANFLEEDLPTADLYILSHVIHDWDDTNVDVILEKVYERMPAGGSLLVVEKVMTNAKDGPITAITNDLMMSMISKGRERSEKEYQQLFAKHGFVNTQLKTIDGYNYTDVMLTKKPFSY